MEFERKRAKTREERLRERRLSKLERKEERLLEEKQPSFFSRKAAEMASPVIHKVKEKTDKPFGVNLMLLNPEADAIAELLVKEEVKVVTTGAGNPEKYMEQWKKAGVRVIPVVASTAGKGQQLDWENMRRREKIAAV